MAVMNMIEAINDALDVALGQDSSVTIFGQDVGYFGGVFRATDGLQRKHGLHRVFDAPIAEGGIVAVAVGMGAYGKRPVVEIQFADYIYPAADQLISEAARMRYRTGGEWWSPITVRSPYGGGIYGGQTHSQSPEGIFTHVAGLKTVIPSTPMMPRDCCLRPSRTTTQSCLSSPSGSTTAPSTGIMIDRSSLGPSIRLVRSLKAITPSRSAKRMSFAKARR